MKFFTLVVKGLGLGLGMGMGINRFFTSTRDNCLCHESAPVWHSSLTKKNISDLERAQKCALRIILGHKYSDYKNALKVLKLDSL